jgi:hypothetical protein
MTNEALTLPDKSKQIAEGRDLIPAARAYACTNDTELQGCMNFFAFVKAKKREVQADVDKDLTPQINMLHKLHKQACDLRTALMLPFEQAEQIIEAIMRPYARKKADAAEAERRRKQEEENRRGEEARQMALLEAELNDAPADVAILTEMPAVVPTVKAEAITEKVEGAEIRRPWRWEVTDPNAIPPDYFMLDTKRVDKEVREQKDKFNVAGIRAFQDVGFSG